MKKGIMKLTVMTFVLAIIFSTSAMAQRSGDDFKKGNRPSPEERAAKSLEKMTKKLELNDYQVDQIKAMQENTIAQAESIKNSDMERADKKEAIKALRDEQKNELKALLDAEQLEKFEKWEAKREERGGKGKGKGKGPRGERPE